MKKYISKDYFYAKTIYNNKEYPISIIPGVIYTMESKENGIIKLKDINGLLDIYVTDDMLEKNFIEKIKEK